MSDVLLGVIAAAVLVMAIIQVAGVVYAVRAARRVGDTVTRLERDVQPIVAELRPIVANLQPIVADLQPIVANLQTMSSDAARAARLAAAQVDRADQLVGDLGRRLDEMGAAVRTNIVTPAREGLALMQALMAAFGALRQPSGSPRKPPAHSEEDDALFIG